MHPVLDASLLDSSASAEPEISVAPNGQQPFETLWNEDYVLSGINRPGRYSWYASYTNNWSTENTMAYVLKAAAAGDIDGLVIIKSVLDGQFRSPRYRQAFFVADTEEGRLSAPMGLINYEQSDGVGIKEWLESLTLPDKEALAAATGRSWEIACSACDECSIRPVNQARAYARLNADEHDNLYVGNALPHIAAIRLAGRYDIGIGNKTFDCIRIDFAERPILREYYVDCAGRTIIARTYAPRKHRPGPAYQTRFLNGEKVGVISDFVSHLVFE